MTMQMNRVENALGCANDQVNPLVCIRELNNRARVIPSEITVHNLQQSWIFPENFHGSAIKEPPKEAIGILASPCVSAILPVWGLDGASDMRDEVLHWLVVAAVAKVPRTCF